MVHASLLPNGKVVFWNTTYTSGQMPNTYVWDPATPSQFTPFTLPARTPDANNIFCSGHTLLASGRVLVAGGQANAGVPYGNPYTNIFDATANNGAGGWSAAALSNMVYSRWYPTTTTLASGAVLVQSGTDMGGTFVSTPEIWEPNSAGGGTWRALSGIGRDDPLAYYPWSYVDPRPGHEGWVFVAGPSSWSDALDTSGNGRWTQTGPNRDTDRTDTCPYPSIREYGSSVLYGNGKILIAGGRSGGDSSGAPTNSAEVLDLMASKPLWRATSAMRNGRKHMTATTLPDGRVLVTGGTSGSCSQESNEMFAVREGEIWDPSNEQWTTAGSMAEARLYHSLAMLLPDGRVLVAGGGEGGACDGSSFASHQTAELYSPSYLFKGARPVILALVGKTNSEVGYNETLQISVAGLATGIAQVNLVRLPSVTHSFNENQAFAKLTISARSTTGASAVSVKMPGRPEELPPGHYMLFVLNQSGVPSVAKIIRVRDPNKPWQQQ